MKGRKHKFGFYILSFVFICSISLLNGCSKSTSMDAPIVAPGIPTDLLASEGTAANVITLTWTPPAGEVLYYRIYRAPVINDVTGEYVLRKDFLYPELINEGTTAVFDDNSLSASKIYSYRVAAVNEGGVSELSDAKRGWADALAPNLPSPPSSGMKATNNVVHEIYLDWAAVSGVTTYHLYRCSTPMGEYQEIAAVTELATLEYDGLNYSYCDNSALWPGGSVEGEAYYYRISSENGEGEGPMSDILNGWFPYQVPDIAPANVAASDGTYANKVEITWEPVAEANSYVVYRSPQVAASCPDTGASSSYVSIGAVSSTSFDDVTADAVLKTVYCYSVRARNEAGESNVYSNVDSGNANADTGIASPGNPSGLTATTDGVNLITIGWTRADDIATHYLVYKSTEALSGYSLAATIADSGAADYTWDDGNGSIGSVTVDTTFYYKVKAVVYEGGNPANPIEAESSLTDHASGLAYPTIPDAATVTATEDAYWNRIDVSWTAVDRAVTYTLYRKIGLGGDWERLAKDMTATEYFDTSAEVEAIWGIDVTYRVYAVNSNGDSTPDPTNASETANFGEDVGTVELGVPQNVSASDGGVWKINISWNAITEANYYILERQKDGESSWVEVNPSILKTGTSYQDAPGELTRFRYRVKSVRGYNSEAHIGPPSNSTGLVWCN